MDQVVDAPQENPPSDVSPLQPALDNKKGSNLFKTFFIDLLKPFYTKIILVLLFYFLMAVVFFQFITNCAPVYPILFGSTNYPCGMLSHGIEMFGKAYSVIGFVSLYLLISVIFYLWKKGKSFPRIIKLILIFLWLVAIGYVEVITTETFPSLEPSFYSNIYSVYYIFEEISMLVIYVYVVSLVLRRIQIKKLIKTGIFVLLLILFVPLSLFTEEFGLSAAIWGGLSLIQSTLYPPPDMNKVVTISNFTENPIIDTKTKKYTGLNTSFAITVSQEGDYMIEAEITTGGPMAMDESQPLFSSQPVTQGMLTGGPDYEFMLHANETKQLSFTFIPSSILFSDQKDGPYYLSVQVSKHVPTISGNFSNLASVNFIGNPQVNNKWKWFTYTPILKTRAYRVTDFEENISSQ